MHHQHDAVDYLLHGYTIRSSILLAAPLSSGDEPPALEVMSGGRRTVPWSVPDTATRLASVRDDRTRSYYSCFRHEGKTVLRFHGACDVVMSADKSTAVVHVDPDADDGISAVIITGALMALRLLLDGELILHASAVDIDGSVFAFVGASGMGKSTLATLLCGHGGGLVTDDVLRVTFDDGQPVAWRGAVESRLRPGAADLQDLFTGSGRVRVTADGRTAVSPPVSGRDRAPLRACVVPMPDRSHSGGADAGARAGRGAVHLAAVPAHSRLGGAAGPGAPVRADGAARRDRARRRGAGPVGAAVPADDRRGARSRSVL